MRVDSERILVGLRCSVKVMQGLFIALGFLQELANVFKHLDLKHLELKSPKTPVLVAADRTGAFSRGFSRGLDMARLELILEDGSKLWCEDVIQEALEFREEYFKEKALPQGEGKES